MASIREMAQKFNTHGFSGSVSLDECLAAHTTMKVGGIAPLFVSPFDVDSLLLALQIFKSSGVDFFTLGGGSNIIVSDKGFSIPVLYLGKMRGIGMIKINWGKNQTA